MPQGQYRPGTVNLNLRMPQWMREALHAHARRLGVPTQRLVRQLIAREIGSNIEEMEGGEREGDDRTLPGTKTGAGRV